MRRTRSLAARALRASAVLASGLGASGSAVAQSLPLDSVPFWSPSEAQLTEAIAFGDLDIDGDLDLVCGNFNEPLSVFFNDSGLLAATPEWNSQLSDPTRAIALGDVDGDGLLDLLVGNWGAPDRLYLGHGRRLDGTPSWSSALVNRTNAIALGDLDGDGDLDLASGATGAPVSLYWNVGGTFGALPDWSSALVEDTRAIGFGDIDGDGDLDLVVGNSDSPNRVYLNVDGLLQAMPDWSAQVADRTRGIALGDVDGDGALDLACAADGSPNRIFMNLGARLDERPYWTTAANEASQSVAFGDADGDGDLDLAFGNSDLGNSRVSVVLENQNGDILMAHGWSTQVGERTTAVAWGDVDGDGDLDLALGNHARPSRVYRNQRRSFEADPAVLGATGAAQSVRLGDFDLDGDLDLASGKLGAPTDVFRNDGGVFGQIPDWSSPLTDPTRNVAWADLDGDGYLELAVANDGAPCRVYDNAAGVLSDAPTWTSALVEATQALAFADLDGDGDPDLACANFDSPNRIYENVAGRLVRDPSWSSALSGPTSALAFGDMDGDGSVDLAVASFEGPVHVYQNFGGTLETAPVWRSDLSETTSSLAWGDVDGDGDLDLACGNIESPIRIYENVDGMLATAPAWSSIFSERIASIAFGDADNDGDLDLACGIENSAGSAGPPGRIYLNDQGTLGEVFTLKSSGTLQTTSIAWGDVDGDGDADLVFADGTPSPYGSDRIFVNRHGMPALVDELVNNPTRLRNLQIRPATSGPNHYEIRYLAVDPESDPFRLTAEYLFQGDPKAIGIDFAETLPSPFLPLASSPSGIEHVFEWDILRLALDPRPLTVRLRASELPQRAGAIQHAGAARRDIERLVPKRPRISVAPESFDFGTICVGDSSALVLYITNRGSEPLALGEVFTPSSEVSVSSLPDTLEPGVATLAALSLTPRSGQPLGGLVMFSSNDPVNPATPMQVDVTVQTLEFSTTRLNDRTPWPLGESVGMLIEPENSFVRIERGAVYYRVTGAEDFTAAPLERIGSSFGAAIPGQMVTELGLEYYIEVENSGVFRFDPPRAPDELHTLAVEPPTAITTLVQPNLGNEIAAGLDATVSIILPVGAQFDFGFLHHRSGGETEYWTSEIVKEPFVRGLIGAEFVSEKGLEYWVEITTVGGAFLTDPVQQPDTAPRKVRVAVRNALEPSTHPGGRYRLLAIPVEFPLAFSGTLLDLLAEQASFGSYDPLRWRSFRYVDGATVEWSRTDPRFRPDPGRAFWLISRSAHRVDTAPIQGFSVRTDQDFQISLEPGWNQFGHPFAFPVLWSDVQKPVEVVDLTAFDPALGSHGAYSTEDVTTLAPFAGYFVRNASSSSVILSIPARQAPQPALPAAKATAQDGWSITLAATLREALATTRLGVHSDASDATDLHDRMAPPSPPGTRLDFGSALAGSLYRQDLRSPAAVQRWSLVLRAEQGGEAIALSADLSRLPASMTALLLDEETKERFDLRAQHEAPLSFVSYGDGESYALTLLAGDAAAVASAASQLVEIPPRVVLDQNAPNPFNPVTRLRFGLPQPARVSLRIFNLRGERVATLSDHEAYPAGYHTLVWDGRDERGGRVASGVYLYSLETPEQVLHRKMLLVQ